MTGLGRRPFGRDRVERIVSRVDPTGRLAVLQAACTAPAMPGELAGEDAAVAAYRAVGHPVSERPYAPARPVRSKVLLVKLVAGFGVIAGGTAAVAVAAGVAPPVPWLDGWGTTTATERPSPSPTVSEQPPTGTAAALCRTYLALPADEAERALDDAPFDELVRRAGGRDEVPGFCAAVPFPPTQPSAEPTLSRSPPETTPPKSPPKATPSKGPKDPPVPTVRPTPRPTGPPSDVAPPTPERSIGTGPDARATSPDERAPQPTRRRDSA
jgi:hypothetical protein